MKKKTTLENYWTVNYQIQHNFTLTKVLSFVLIKLRTKQRNIEYSLLNEETLKIQ